MKKTLKHLKKNWYRYGLETLVVITGVLIAFSLNNWNEKRKATNLEREYFERLEEDLIQDTIYFQLRIEQAHELIGHLNSFLSEMYTLQDSYQEFQELMCCIDYPPTELHINSSTYSELVSTGNINIINKTEVRASVISHYENYIRINKHLIEYDNYSNIVLGNLDMEVKPLTLLKKYFPNPEDYADNTWKFINDPSSKEFKTLENTVATFIDKLVISINYLEEINSSTRSLLLKLD